MSACKDLQSHGCSKQSLEIMKAVSDAMSTVDAHDSEKYTL